MKKLKKGYKDTEVGIIPQDWEVKSIGEIFSFYPTASYSRAQMCSENKYACIHYGDIHTKFHNFIDLDKATLPCVSEKQARPYIPLENGDLIVADASEDYAGVGKSIEIINTDKKAIAGLHTLLLRDKEKLFVNGYKGYIFHNINVKRSLDRIATGLKVYSLSKGSLIDILLPIPLKKEQQAIAEALSDIDALINALNKQIEKKKNIKQGAMQNLLTGKKRLNEFTGEWETKELEKIGTFYSGYGFPIKYQGDKESNIPFLKVSDLNLIGNEKYLNLSNNYISESVLKIITAKTFPKNTIVFAKIGAAIFLERKRILFYDSCIDNNMMGFISDAGNYDFQYMYYVFLNMNLSLYANTTALPSLNGKELSLIEIEVPPTKEEQTAIAQILTEMDNEMEQLEKKRDKYLNIKSGMMQQLLTGQIRLINTASCLKTQEVKIDSTNSKKKHSKQFDEVVIISFLVDKFGSTTEPLSRFMYTKLSYLIHRKHDCVVVDYKKFAAGPYNPKSRYGGPEKIGKENEYFDLVKDAKGYDAFVPQKNIQEAVDYFTQWYGTDIQNWIEQFRQYKPWDLETLATVDMAINDLEEKGVKATVNTVKTYLSSIPKWKVKLDKPHFSDVHIQRAINESIRLFKI